MKIFFNASLTGKRIYFEQYRAIIGIIKGLGYKLITPVELGNADSVSKETLQESERYYRNLIKWIADSDLAMFEVSFPSTGIGHEIAVALHKGKPVIALYTNKKTPFVLESITDDKLQVVNYEIPNLEKTLRHAVDYASERRNIRFTFFLPPEMQNFLDWITETTKKSRSEYIRAFIGKEMQANKQWKKATKRSDSNS